MYAETAVAPALSAIAPTRHWARERLTEAGVDDGRLELLVLLVSEVVTNAVAHADPPVTLRVHVDDQRTRVDEDAQHGSGPVSVEQRSLLRLRTLA